MWVVFGVEFKKHMRFSKFEHVLDLRSNWSKMSDTGDIGVVPWVFWGVESESGVHLTQFEHVRPKVEKSVNFGLLKNEVFSGV